FKQPTPENVVKAALALLSAISFVGIAHLWPWYLVWTLAFAAVLPTWWLSRFVVGVSILAPITLAVWWVDLFPFAGQSTALAMYGLAALWCVLTRAPAPAPERSPDPFTGGSFGHP